VNDSKRHLTVRAVKSRLTREGVDHRPLRITQLGDQVKVEGDGRQVAFHVLLDAGLTVAPYSGYHLWTRR